MRCRTLDCADIDEDCDVEQIVTLGCEGITLFYVIGVIMPAVTGLLGGAPGC